MICGKQHSFYGRVSLKYFRESVKHAARVNPGQCMGCGTCVAVCPSMSVDIEGFTEQQVYAQVECLPEIA